MAVPRLLIQAGTRRRYIYTAALAERPDMTEIAPEPESMPEPPTPEPTTPPRPSMRRFSRKESP